MDEHLDSLPATGPALLGQASWKLLINYQAVLLPAELVPGLRTFTCASSPGLA